VNPFICIVAFVQEVHDDHIMRLPIAMAASDALFDPLRVPRKVVVDDLRAELQVDTLGGGLGCDHDRGIVAEFFYQCSTNIDGARSCNLLGALRIGKPALVNFLCLAVGISATEGHNLIGVTVAREEIAEIVLGAARLCEDQGFSLCAHPLLLRKAYLESL